MTKLSFFFYYFYTILRFSFNLKKNVFSFCYHPKNRIDLKQISLIYLTSGSFLLLLLLLFILNSLLFVEMVNVIFALLMIIKNRWLLFVVNQAKGIDEIISILVYLFRCFRRFCLVPKISQQKKNCLRRIHSILCRLLAFNMNVYVCDCVCVFILFFFSFLILSVYLEIFWFSTYFFMFSLLFLAKLKYFLNFVFANLPRYEVTTADSYHNCGYNSRP